MRKYSKKPLRKTSEIEVEMWRRLQTTPLFVDIHCGKNIFSIASELCQPRPLSNLNHEPVLNQFQDCGMAIVNNMVWLIQSLSVKCSFLTDFNSYNSVKFGECYWHFIIADTQRAICCAIAKISVVDIFLYAHILLYLVMWKCM
jgi:hypothetical protein